MAANLSLVISAVDKASGTIQDVEKSAGGLGKTAGTVLKAGFIVGAAGIGIATVAGIKFVQAAMEEEAGIRRLATAVDASGGSWAKSGRAIEDVIRKRERLAFSDDDLRSSLAMLTAQTGDVDEAIRRQAVAMDLARGANIDLGTASQLLGKVTDESHAALSRMGITIDKNATATEVLEAVQQKFSGQAATFADTAAGKWEQFGNQLQNLKEVIGTALLPVVTALGEWLTDVLIAAIPKVEELAQKLVAVASPVVKEGIDKLKVAFDDVKTAMVNIATSSEFEAFLDGVNDGLTNIRDLAVDAKDKVIEAFGKIDDVLRNLPGFDKLTTGLKTVGEDKEQMRDVGQIFTSAAAGILAFSVAAPVLDTAINMVGNSIGALSGAIVAFALLPNPFILIIFAIALLAGALITLELKTKFLSQKLIPFLKNEVGPVLQDVGKHFEKLARFWIPLIAEALVTLRQGWEDIQPAIEPTAKFLAGVLGPIFEKIGAFLKEHPILITALIAAILLIVAPWLLVVGALIIVLAKWDEIKAMFTETIPAAIDSVIAKVTEFPIIGEIIKGAFEAIKVLVEFYWNVYFTVISTAINLIKNYIELVVALIKGDWDRVWQEIKQIVDTVWSGILGLITAWFGLIQGGIRVGLDVVKGIFGDVWNLIKGALIDAMNGIISVVESGINEVIGAVRDLFQHIKDVADAFPGPNPLGNAMQAAIDGMSNVTLGRIPQAGAEGAALGAAAVDGVRAGIRDRQVQLLIEVDGMSQSVANRMAHMLEVQSPSRVMMRIGRNVVEGLRLGIANETAKLTPVIAGMAAQISMPLTVESPRLRGGNLLPATSTVSHGDTYHLSVSVTGVTSQAQKDREARDWADTLRRYRRFSG